MEWILGPFLSYLLLYKYVALFVIAFVAALILPVPASSTLAAAGAFASQGYFDFATVIMVALAANIAGDATGYMLARKYGEAALSTIGFRRILRSRRYQKLSRYIFEYPQSLIYFTRFLTEAGPAVNLLAGLSRVPPKTFFLFDILGETSYVILYGSAGYILGSQWENNLGFLAKIPMVVLPLGLSVYLIQVFLFRPRRQRQ